MTIDIKTSAARVSRKVRGFVRFRPLMATVAVLMMLVASRETTWGGFVDRLIQFVCAYIAFAFAIPPDKPNNAVRGAADTRTLDGLVGRGGSDAD